MSEPQSRSDAPISSRPLTNIAAIAPVTAPLAFPAVTSEGVTPLRVPAISRAEAARRLAEIEAASAASPSSTGIKVRVLRPQADPLGTGMQVAAVVVVMLALAALVWGVIGVVRGLEARASRVELTAPGD